MRSRTRTRDNSVRSTMNDREEPMTTKAQFANLVSIAAIGFALLCSPVTAQSASDAGVTATEIKIGNTSPYSGPVSAYATMARTAAAYFKQINDEGGINGRKIN